MKTKTTLLSGLFTFVLMVVGLTTSAQITDPDSVCAGSVDVVYGVNGVPATSNLQWWLDDPSAGTIDNSISANNDEIQIDWGVTAGDYTLFVVETTDNGCLGDTIELPVRINDLPTAIVALDSAVCEGFGTTITFTFTGEAPWDVEYTDGTNNYTFTTSSNPHAEPVGAYTSTQTIDVVSVTDGNDCDEASPQTGLSITIYPGATTGPIYHY